MRVKAIAKDVGISSQKLRLVADAVRGKVVEEASAWLRFSPTPAARAVAKVVKSAVANAENNFGLNTKKLKIVEVIINEGHRLKRARSQARGRVAPIIRRSSHITIVVSEEG